jgi:hypothetical protein
MSKIEIIPPNGSAGALTGFGRSKRKIATLGHIKSEMRRLYGRLAEGTLHPDDFKTAMAGLKLLSDVIEKADLERRIDELERLLIEARNAR